MAQEELKGNLLHPGQWLRMLFMLGYVFVVWVVGLVLLVIMITQTVTVLFTGTTNAHLKHFGILVNIYLFQIVDFLVYGSEQKPFPFKPFPDTHIVPPGSAPGPTSGAASHDPVQDEPVVTPQRSAASPVTPAAATSGTAAAATAPASSDPYVPPASASSIPPDPYAPPPASTAYPGATEPVPDPYADLDSEPDAADRADPDIVPDVHPDDTKRI